MTPSPFVLICSVIASGVLASHVAKGSHQSAVTVVHQPAKKVGRVAVHDLCPGPLRAKIRNVVPQFSRNQGLLKAWMALPVILHFADVNGIAQHIEYARR